MDRNTIQRDLVRNAAMTLDHPTADEVYEYISKEYPSVSRCTVYRNLNKLTDRGELRHISLSGSPDRFDITVTPHYHARCISCGRIADVELKSEPKLVENITQAYGFSVTGCEILFSGICSDCMENKI